MSAAIEPEPRGAGIAAAAWSELIAFLARGGRSGGAAYEDLRQRLQLFFEWKGCGGAPDLADETLNRVAAKLAAGEQIVTDEPWRYAFGVARFVYLEAVKRNARHTQVERGDSAEPRDGDRDAAAQREARLAALEACLGALPPRTQQMLLRYHEDDGRQRIDHRKQLADELGIALNALRIRVHRVRLQIEDCVRSRLARTDRATAATARRSSP
jgi:DNA-directed RNA polymerase specialized sigma24 family protein